MLLKKYNVNEIQICLNHSYCTVGLQGDILNSGILGYLG